MPKPYAGKSSFSVLAVLATLCLASPSAFGQSGANGAIIGSVYDQTGQPIKGVKITARSETQIGGAKVTYTNEEGMYRVVGLQPGDFEVLATAPKLKTVVQKDIKVGVTTAAEVDLVMEIETATEEVRVVEKAPIVSTTTAVVKEVYDEEFVDNLPQNDRHAIESTIGESTPGVVNSSGRAARIRGGGENQSQFLIEGFYVNGQKIAQKALAAFEVQTAGYGAENATAGGGVVNMVTKSGSNKFEYEVSGFAEDSHLTFFKDAYDGKEWSWNYYISPQVGGPIVKDRVWFFAQTELRSSVWHPEKDPTGFFPQRSPYTYMSWRGSAKFTWQVTPRNKLQNFTQFNRTYNKNINYGSWVDPDAQAIGGRWDYFTGLIWESLLTDKLFLRSQAGVSQLWDFLKPQNCLRDSECEHIVPIIQYYPTYVQLNNYSYHSENKRSRFQVLNTLEGFVNSKTFGDHSIKLKDDFYTEYSETAESTPGDQVIYYNGLVPSSRDLYFSNDPRLEDERFGWFIRGSRGMRNQLSLTDQARITRYLTVNPGIAFVTSQGTNNHNDEAVSRSGWSPSLSVAYDPTHDGRTVLRGSFAVLADAEATALARHLLGDRTRRRDYWDDTTKEWVPGSYSGGALTTRTIGLPCGQSGIDQFGRDCRSPLRMPRTWEYTLGTEREIVQGIALGADFIYRVFTHPYETAETNRIWNSAGTALVGNGSYRNGRQETISDLETNDGVGRRYAAVTAAIRKREGALKMQAAYTWSRLYGNHLDGTNNEWGENDGRDRYLWGPLPDDMTHTVRIGATYQVSSWLNAGALYNYYSGRPYSRRFRNDVLGGFTDYRAQRGTNPGNNINDPGDDYPLRLPDIQRLNLQFRGNLKPLIGYRIEAYVDVINVLALRTTTSVREEDTATFGQLRGRMEPFTLRLGFNFKF